MNFIDQNHLDAPSIFSDIQSLNRIRKQAIFDNQGAVKEAAKEFEAFFMNMMLKSMRQAGEVMGSDSLTSSPQEKMFIGMLDEQMSVELSQKGTLGIADLMARSLLGEDAILSKNNRLNNTTFTHQTIQKKSTPELTINIQPAALSIKEIPSHVLLSKNQKTEIELSTVPTKVVKDKLVTETKKSLFESASQFIQELLPAATEMAKKIGVEPKLLIAQAALETGWGQYIMHDKNGRSSNNLFGIKSGRAWKGQSVNVNTMEVDSGTLVKVKDNFRMYDSFEKSFSDYVDFLKTNPRYQSALNLAKDAKKYLESLQEAGYATDPNYAKKILEIFNNDIQKIHSKTDKQF